VKKKACKKEQQPNSARGSLYNVLNPEAVSAIVTFSGVKIAGTGIRLAQDHVLDSFAVPIDRDNFLEEVVSRGTTFGFDDHPSVDGISVRDAVAFRGDPSNDQSVGFRLAADVWGQAPLPRQIGLTWITTLRGMENRRTWNRMNTVRPEKREMSGKFAGFRLVFSDKE
jgi:hypothetical protein